MHLEYNVAHHKCTEKVHPSEDANNLWLISDILLNVVFVYFHDFWLLQSHIFAKFAQNPLLKCKLWTFNSFRTHKVSRYWFGAKFLWLKMFFVKQSDFLYFGVSSNYSIYRELQWRGCSEKTTEDHPKKFSIHNL